MQQARTSAASNSARKSSGCAAASDTGMKFPLRLTLDLWRSRVSQLFAGGNRTGTIVHLPAALLPVLHQSGGGNPAKNGHSAAESVRAAAHTAAPVLWIGGSEPLEHSEVGRVAFALNGKGRNVFVH